MRRVDKSADTDHGVGLEYDSDWVAPEQVFRNLLVPCHNPLIFVPKKFECIV